MSRLLRPLAAGFVVVVAFLAASVLCQAQPQFQWAKGIQTTYNVYGSSSYAAKVHRSANGNLYQRGLALFCNDFNPEPALDTHCVMVTAHPNFIPGSPSSNFVSIYDATTGLYKKTQLHPYNWSQPIFTDSGFIYFTGFFQGTQDFDPGPGTYNLTAQATLSSGQGCDYFLAKYDTSYNIIWAKRIAKSDAASYQEIRQTLCDAQGNVYILGEFSPHLEFVGQASWGNNNGTAAGFLAKFSPAGNLLWANRIYTGSFAQVYGLAQDGIGNLVISGFAGNTMSQPVPLIFTGTSGNVTAATMTSQFCEAFVAKYSASGAVLWTRMITGPDHQLTSDLTVDSSGNIFLIGPTYGVTTFDSSNIQGSTFTATTSNLSNTRRESYLAKYNSQGAFQWFKQLATVGTTGIVFTEAIAVDADGQVYAGGSFKGTINLTPGASQPVQYTMLSTDGDAFLVSYNGTNGQYAWSNRFTAPHSTIIKGLHADKFRNLYVTGGTSHTTNFNPGGSGGTVTYVDFFPQAARARAFLLKYFIPQPTSVESADAVARPRLHPNPTSGDVIAEGVEAGSTYLVLSMLGQRVRQGTVAGTSDRLSIADLPTGTYVVVLTAPDGARNCTRILKQ